MKDCTEIINTIQLSFSQKLEHLLQLAMIYHIFKVTEVKIAGRNINNLRYTDHTILIAES